MDARHQGLMHSHLNIFPAIESPDPLLSLMTDLELGVALVEQNINDAQLADVAVLLKLLADLGTDNGNGHVQRVHGLDLRGL